jgi:hypothetical protein
MIDGAILREAALELLASSTARRYIREARRLAMKAGLPEILRSDAGKLALARTRVAEILRQIEREAERSPAEFEAAILLCALARVSPEETSTLLDDASRTSSLWVRALALRLLALGPPREDELADLEGQLATVLVGSVGVGEPVHASDRSDPGLFPRAA